MRIEGINAELQEAQQYSPSLSELRVAAGPAIAPHTTNMSELDEAQPTSDDLEEGLSSQEQAADAEALAPQRLDPENLPTLIRDENRHPQPWCSAERAIRAASINPYGKWRVIDSSLAKYERYFQGALEAYGGDMSRLLPESDDPVTVVDLMATPQALRDLRTRLEAQRGEVTFRGIAVGLDDTRTPQQQDDDNMRGITFVHGNLRYPATWRRIEEALDGAGADLVMERALAGLDAIPLHREVYEAALQKVWTITKLGGVMLLEVPTPREFQRAGISWSAMVEDLRDQGVEVEPDKYMMYGLSRNLRIRRTF